MGLRCVRSHVPIALQGLSDLPDTQNGVIDTKSEI
jgi:hypothetical protein